MREVSHFSHRLIFSNRVVFDNKFRIISYKYISVKPNEAQIIVLIIINCGHL